MLHLKIFECKRCMMQWCMNCRNERNESAMSPLSWHAYAAMHVSFCFPSSHPLPISGLHGFRGTWLTPWQGMRFRYVSSSSQMWCLLIDSFYLTAARLPGCTMILFQTCVMLFLTTKLIWKLLRMSPLFNGVQRLKHGEDKNARHLFLNMASVMVC